MDCPHCFRRIIPLQDGMCPACRANTRVPPRGAEDLVAVVVAEKSSLPETCCGCGRWTRRKVSITSSRRQTGTDVVSSKYDDEGASSARLLSILAFGRLFTALFSLLASGAGSREPGTMTVCVPMPHCPDCSQLKALEPVLVNYDYCSMRFAVHKQFAKELVRLTRSRRQNSNPNAQARRWLFLHLFAGASGW